MGTDLREYLEHPPTPRRLARVRQHELVGRCPTIARRQTRTDPDEYVELVKAVIDLRALEDQPTIRQIAQVTGYGKSTIGRIVAEYGL